MRDKNWTREELVVTINLYFKIPFSRINYSNPEIIELAELIGRTPSAVAFKLVNFASLDPTLKKRNVSGMKHRSKADEIIWNEFHNNWEKLAFESENILARIRNQPIERSAGITLESLPKVGKEREITISARINQSFFRKFIIASYNNCCCITGIKIPELLVASHIIPWSIDKENRMNPKNGICLNVLHDKAFDQGLITITPAFKIKLSPQLLNFKNNHFLENSFLCYEDKQITLPYRFIPDPKFLKYHNKNIYKNN